MRARALVAIFLFMLLVTCAAAACGQPEQANGASAQKYDLFQKPATTRQFALGATTLRNHFLFDKSGHRIRTAKAPRWAFDRNLLTGGTDCYTMRTYTVERIDNTDATRPAGYTDCVPSKKVQIKNADAPGEEPKK